MRGALGGRVECREESGVVYYPHLTVIVLLRREGGIGAEDGVGEQSGAF